MPSVLIARGRVSNGFELEFALIRTDPNRIYLASEKVVLTKTTCPPVRTRWLATSEMRTRNLCIIFLETARKSTIQPFSLKSSAPVTQGPKTEDRDREKRECSKRQRRVLRASTTETRMVFGKRREVGVLLLSVQSPLLVLNRLVVDLTTGNIFSLDSVVRFRTIYGRLESASPTWRRKEAGSRLTGECC
jgi:hypothetical protein